MICCNHSARKRHGRDRYGNQRYRCLACGQTFIERKPKILGTMRLELARAETVLRMLLEGCSIRSTERLSGVNRNTIMALLVLVGTRSQQFCNDRMREIVVNDVEVDEVWGFVGCKERTKERLKKSDEFGHAYCFTAMERDTKLMIAWHLGKRTADDTQWFCDKLAATVSGRLQLTTDGFKPYTSAVIESFRSRVDFAQLIKVFGKRGGDGETYTPAAIKTISKRVRAGNPDKDRISTSIVERSNLTIRMKCRRMTRLTNGFSKKWENHEAALAFLFTAYNFVIPHGTLKTTPAHFHGLTDHKWTLRELLRELVGHS